MRDSKITWRFMKVFALFFGMTLFAGCASLPKQVSKSEFILTPKQEKRLKVVSSGAKGESDLESARGKAKTDAHNWRTFNDLGLVYFKERMFGKAVSAFKQALTLHPLTTQIEAEQKEQARLDARRTEIMKTQESVQKAQEAAQVQNALMGMLGSMAMVSPDPNAGAMVSMLQSATSVQSIPKALAPEQIKVESIFKTKQEVSLIYENLGRAQLADHDCVEAISSFNSAMASDPSRMGSLIWIANAQFSLGYYAESITTMQQFFAISSTKNPASSYLCMADAFNALGMAPEADRALGEAIREYQKILSANTSNQEIRDDALLTMGKIFLSHDRYKDAIECFNKVPDLSMLSEAALKGRAICRIVMALYAEARDDLLRLAEKDLPGGKVLNADTASHMRYLLGVALEGMGAIDQAKQAFQDALMIYEKAHAFDTTVPDYVALAYAGVGEHDKAIRLLEENLAEAPLVFRAAVTWYNLGLAYEKAGRFPEAFEAMDRCLNMRFGYRLAKDAVARLFQKTAEKRDAALKRGNAAIQKKDYAEAVKGLSIASQLMPWGDQKQEIVQNMLASVARLKEPPAITKKAYEHSLRGSAFLGSAKEIADFDLAISEYRWAIVDTPWFSRLYLEAAVACGSREKYTEAVKYMKLFLAGCPDAKSSRDVFKQLYLIKNRQLQERRALAKACRF